MNSKFYKILKKFGTDRRAIRALFTTRRKELTADTKPLFEEKVKKENAYREQNKQSKLTEDEIAVMKENFLEDMWSKRTHWETKINNRIEEGRRRNLKDYRFYMVSDLAWDSAPIVPENIPLQLYAQGRINLETCHNRMKKCVEDNVLTQNDVDKMFVTDPEEPNTIKELNLPRLHEVSVNLVRPMVRRRVAAQANKYNKQHPFFKYDTRSKDMVSKLRGDIMSQRVEMMSDQMGYREDMTQALRKNFLYSHCVELVERAWLKEKQFREKHSPSVAVTEDLDTAELGELEAYVVKEGVPMVRPHPTRVFYDQQYSLSTINYGHGCKWVGYWDVNRWSDISDNPNFFNKEAIEFSRSNHFSHYQDYFDYYFVQGGECIMNFPTYKDLNSQEENNKRDSTLNYYNDSNGDDGVWVASYYERVKPKEVGIGSYPHEVWVRLNVASDNTVVFGEILPTSICGAYMGHDCDNSKNLNLAMAHEIIPYQDQIANLWSQALYLMKIQSILVMAVDTDTLTDDQRAEIQAIAKGSKYYSEMMLVEHSASDDKDVFGEATESRPPISLVQSQTNIGNVITELLNGVGAIMNMLDRTQMMSPQEAGSFATGERTTAQEVNEVSATTNALFSFASEGPDQFRDAKKRILAESLLALGSKDVEVHVQERYPDDVIQAAGFKPKFDNEISGYKVKDSDKQTLMGNLISLDIDYIFTSRDGGERAISTQSAKVISDLTRYVFSTPDIFQVFVDQFGIEQIANMISEVFRLSGAGFILKVPATAATQQEQAGALLTQLEQALESQDGINEDIANEINALKSGLQTIATSVGGGTALPPAPQPAAIPAGQGGEPAAVEVAPPQPTGPPTVLTTGAP
jgi:hypothetical protein